MRQLSLPTTAPAELLLDCIASISEDCLKNKYIENLEHLESAVEDFDEVTATRTWCELQHVPFGQLNRIVAGALSKKNLLDLYTKYMVGSTGPSRSTYDDLLVAANGRCPFCAGVGHVKTLDHYLPKARYPLYSVLPSNLVPCCRDCNSGKGGTFATVVGEQAIHPYLDDLHFFSEKWAAGIMVRTNPITIRFEIDPPAHWSGTDRERVSSHFDNYDLARRFGIEAAAHLASLIYLRSTILKDNSSDGFRDFLLENARDPNLSINGWRRVLYAALAETDWFYEADFSIPDGHMPGND